MARFQVHCLSGIMKEQIRTVARSWSQIPFHMFFLKHHKRAPISNINFVGGVLWKHVKKHGVLAWHSSGMETWDKALQNVKQRNAVSCSHFYFTCTDFPIQPTATTVAQASTSKRCDTGCCQCGSCFHKFIGTKFEPFPCLSLKIWYWAVFKTGSTTIQWEIRVIYRVVNPFLTN